MKEKIIRLEKIEEESKDYAKRILTPSWRQNYPRSNTIRVQIQRIDFNNLEIMPLNSQAEPFNNPGLILLVYGLIAKPMPKVELSEI